MRSKGPCLTLGSGGSGCVRSTLPNRPQLSATVRNRSQPSATVRVRAVWPCLWSFLEVSTVATSSFRVAGVELRDIQTCFVKCRKSLCVAGAVLWRYFCRISCSFRGRDSALDTSSVILRGTRSTLDVSCCVFLRIALSRLRQVATRCKFRGRRGVL